MVTEVEMTVWIQSVWSCETVKDQIVDEAHNEYWGRKWDVFKLFTMGSGTNSSLVFLNSSHVHVLQVKSIYTLGRFRIQYICNIPAGYSSPLCLVCYFDNS